MLFAVFWSSECFVNSENYEVLHVDFLCFVTSSCVHRFWPSPYFRTTLECSEVMFINNENRAVIVFLIGNGIYNLIPLCNDVHPVSLFCLYRCVLYVT